ncbi:MAG: hypothetical protein U0136_00335 [Bdellovibrionota bacterium]
MNRKLIAPVTCGLVTAYMAGSLVIRSPIVDLGTAGIALATSWFIFPLSFLAGFFSFRDTATGIGTLFLSLLPMLATTIFLMFEFALPPNGAGAMLIAVFSGSYLGAKLGQVVYRSTNPPEP